MEVYLGIDLGTTTTLVARAIQGSGNSVDVDILDIEQKDGLGNSKTLKYLPSVAFFPENGDPIVGLEAEIIGPEKNASRFVRAIKRQMGRDIPFPIAGYQPSDIAALYLDHALKIVHKNLPQTHEMVFTVTVPASFTTKQRADTLIALKTACRKTGVHYPDTDENALFISEPTAAMLAFLHKELSSPITNINFSKVNRFIVYDIGGGTLDLTQVFFRSKIEHPSQLTDLEIVVEDISRYNPFGGEDFDRKLAEWIHQCILDKYPALEKITLSPQERLAVRLQLLRIAKEIKQRLSDKIEQERSDDSVLFEGEEPEEPTENYINDRFTIKGKTYPFPITLTETEYLKIVRDLISEREDIEAQEDVSKNLFSSLRRMLAKNNRSSEDLDGLLVVGGAARLPIIWEKLQEFWGNNKVYKYIPPDHAVVSGAAIYSLLRRVKNFTIEEKAADAYYIYLKDGLELVLGQSKNPQKTTLGKKLFEFDNTSDRLVLQFFAGEEVLDSSEIGNILPTLIYQGSILIELGQEYKKGTAVWIQMRYESSTNQDTLVPWVYVWVDKDTDPPVFQKSFSEIIHREV